MQKKKGGDGGPRIGAADNALKSKLQSKDAIDTARKTARMAEQELRERLAQELAASKVNAAKVSEQWRQILRITKLEDLKHELEVLAQGHERDVERKDSLIDGLLGDLKEADTQYDRAVRTHLQQLDKLLDIQDSRLVILEQEFKREVAALEEEFAIERAEIVSRHRAFRTEMLHVTKAVREEEEAKAAAAHAEFEQQREALKRRNLERIHVLQSEMDSAIESLEKKFEEAHLAYLSNTDSRTADFKALSERGQHDTQMNDRQQRALKRLNKLLQLWRSKNANNVRECEERNETLESERDEVAKHLDALKADMARARTINVAKLKTMSTQAAAAKAVLVENTSLAQRVLSLAENLRALESGLEKVDPFLSSLSPAAPVALDAGPDGVTAASAGATAVAAIRAQTAALEHELIQHAVAAEAGAGGAGSAGVAAAAATGRSIHLLLQAATEEEAALVAPGTDSAIAEAEALHHFYSRYNKALMETLALERQRERLRKEHAELQAALAGVLGGLSVTSTTMDSANTLLVVNGRTGAGAGAGAGAGKAGPLPVAMAMRPVATVALEAGVIAQSYARQR